MYVPFLLFVIAIVLVVIFWELTKINTRLRKASVPPGEPVKDSSRKEP